MAVLQKIWCFGSLLIEALGSPPFHKNILILCLMPLLLTHLSCKKDESEILSDIQEDVETGKRHRALAEIQKYLSETNNAHSEFIAPALRVPSLASSIFGEVAAWLDNEKLNYYSTDGLRSFETETRPIHFQLSSSGRFISLIFQTDKKCQLATIDTKENTGKERPWAGPCREAPLISDDGRYLFVKTPKQIQALLLKNAHQENGNTKDEGLDFQQRRLQKTEPKSIPRSVFRRKFKKIQSRIYLRQFAVHGWIAFYGRAGAYDLYFYPGVGSKVLRNKESYARPYLYHVYDGNSMDVASADAVSEPAGKRAPASYLFGRAHGFAYSGGAGKWKLEALRFTERVVSAKGFPSPSWDALQFLKDREEFMVLKKRHLYYWNPLTKKRQLLPLLARDFLLFENGLLYVDLKGRLYLRKTPFSKFEIELAHLRKKLQSLELPKKKER